MKTVKHNNAQRNDWQHNVLLSVFKWLLNPCSMSTQGRPVSIVNPHENAYSAYFKADKSFQMTIDVTGFETQNIPV